MPVPHPSQPMSRVLARGAAQIGPGRRGGLRPIADTGDGNATANMSMTGDPSRGTANHYTGRVYGSELALEPRHGLPTPGRLESYTQVGGPNHGQQGQAPTGIPEYVPGGGVYRGSARNGAGGEVLTPIIDPESRALLGYRGTMAPTFTRGTQYISPRTGQLTWPGPPIPPRYQGGEYQIQYTNPIPRTGQPQPHRYPNVRFGDPKPEGFDPTHGPMGYPVNRQVSPYHHRDGGMSTTIDRGSWIISGGKGLHWRPNITRGGYHLIGAVHGTAAQQRAEQAALQRRVTAELGPRIGNQLSGRTPNLTMYPREYK